MCYTKPVHSASVLPLTLESDMRCKLVGYALLHAAIHPLTWLFILQCDSLAPVFFFLPCSHGHCIPDSISCLYKHDIPFVSMHLCSTFAFVECLLYFLLENIFSDSSITVSSNSMMRLILCQHIRTLNNL